MNRIKELLSKSIALMPWIVSRFKLVAAEKYWKTLAVIATLALSAGGLFVIIQDQRLERIKEVNKLLVEAETLLQNQFGSTYSRDEEFIQDIPGVLTDERKDSLANAKDLIEQARLIIPDHAPTERLDGVRLALGGETEKAIAAYEKAVQIDAEYARAYMNLGNAYMRKGQFANAFKYFGIAIEKDAEEGVSAITYANYSIILRERGYLKKAEELLRKAIEIDPQNYDALNGLGVTLDLRGDLAGALDAFDGAISLSQSGVLARHNRAVILFALKRYEEALKEHKQLIDEGLGNATSYADYGLVLETLGEPEQAQEYYRKARRLDTEIASRIFEYATRLEEAGQRERAIDEYLHTLSIEPDMEEARKRLGDVYMKQRKPEDAESVYREMATQRR